MAANVETMFYTDSRRKPWHGLGICVENAPTSRDALVYSGLDWRVIQRNLKTSDGISIPGFKANIRETDKKVLGIVTDRYTVVQNEDAFAFTDTLLGEGVRYETAGSLNEGKRTWILARLPHQYIINGEEIYPYIVFSNSHDGSSGIKAAVTPIRVVCSNSLSLSLKTAKRCWSTVHCGDMSGKLEDARKTLLYANNYMREFGKELYELNRKALSDQKVYAYIDELFPIMDSATEQQKKNIIRIREDVKSRYYDAPDLQHVGKNAYRFVNAVSDFATHAKPLRESANYRENLFSKTIDGNILIDRAYTMVKAV